MGTLTLGQNTFLLNGKPFRILAGAMHYFRVHPEHWKDRMLKMRALGLNTLETYVAWNLHEPRPGQFDFSGWLDLQRYIQMAADLGLYVLLRPGPYICSEWEMGGLPAWLLKDHGMRLRCMYPPYIQAVDAFFDRLMPLVAPLQITRGGPILAVQVENEYGSYGNDKTYLKHLEDGLRARGIDVLLYTSDDPSDEMLQYGELPHIFKTANFGSQAIEAFARLREYQPEGPLMCAEFWNGWFDHWGEAHHTRTPAEAAQVLDEILTAGASVSLYMFHGGATFGWMNGANDVPDPHYEPTVNGYDSDAPLTEAGDPTPKYFAFRDAIRKVSQDVPDQPPPGPAPRLALGRIPLTETAPLLPNLDLLSTAHLSGPTRTMEDLDQSYGFIHYQTRVSGPRAESRLTLLDLHDRAHVFVDGALRGILERETSNQSLALSVAPQGCQIDILVENMGRVNYGANLDDRKGITRGVLLGQQYLFGWKIYPLPLDDLASLPFTPGAPAAGEYPAFFRGAFQVEHPADTHLALPGWTRGVVWINGFNLGRYWNRGPQKTLYLPGPLLRVGVNNLVILELHGTRSPEIELRSRPDLG
jgi:beta-galactosidase